MLSHRHLVLGFASLAFSVVSIAPSTFILGSNPVFAKNDGDHGNGGGNDRDNGNDKAAARGNGGGNGGGNGASAHSDSAGVSHGKSDSAPGQDKSSSGPGSRVVNFFKGLVDPPAAKPKGLDAQIASLHAANANLQAFMHASPNSKVGQIAAYAKAEVAVETATAALAAAQTAAASAAAALTTAQTAHTADVALLTAAPYNLTNTSDAALQALLPTVTDTVEIAAINKALADSAAVAAAQVAVDTSATAVATATTDLATAQATATTALDTAANDNRTPVSPEVQAWVDAQLAANGVMDYFRSLATPPPPMP